MEDWFASGVGLPLPVLIRDRRVGTPTASIQCDFALPLKMGDMLRFELRVTKLGNASVQLAYSGTKDGVEHLKILQTIVFVSLDAGRAVPVPEELRARIQEYLVG